MSMAKRFFGTDGIRGRVGQPPICPDIVLKLAWAAGMVFKKNAEGGRAKVVIGKDTRVSGYMFESALESGLSAAGVDVLLLGPMPTPAIANLTTTFRADAGIVISASHNPFYDNGIKFFSAEGLKLDDETELAIEQMMDEDLQCVDSKDLGKATRVDDAAGRYIQFCKSTLPGDMRFSGLKLVVDCAHGANYHVAPQVLEELGADVVAIGCEPDGFNINQGVGSTHIDALSKAVVEHGAQLGVAFDGDADRVIMVDDHGQVFDGDDLIYILACDRQARQLPVEQVVGTVMTNLGVELALKAVGIGMIRVSVGDRHVSQALRQYDLALGGEASGHILYRDFTSCGDGLVNALQVLRVVVGQGKSLAELTADVEKLPHQLINVPLGAKPFNLSNYDKAIADAELRLGDEGRLLIRSSGTEPVVRVMVEGRDERLVVSIAEDLARIIADDVSCETTG